MTWTKYPDRNVAIFDIMNQGCCKGQALKFWARQCGIPASDVMAIGDNFNDLEMLEFAGLPVVMGNHIDGLPRPGLGDYRRLRRHRGGQRDRKVRIEG